MGNIFPQQTDEPLQRRHVLVVPVIHAEGDLRQIRNGDIAEIHVPCGNDIGVQRVPQLRLCESEGAFCIFGKIPLLRAQPAEDAGLGSEDRIRDLAGRTGDEFPVQLRSGKRAVGGQRMLRGADACQRDPAQRPEEEGRCFLFQLYAQGCVHLFVLDEPHEGGEGDHPDVRPQQRVFSGQVMEDRREQAQFHAVVAAEDEGDVLFPVPQALFRGQGGLQDELGVAQELDALAGQGHRLAGPEEQLRPQFLLQRLDLVGDCRLGDLQHLGGF